MVPSDRRSPQAADLIRKLDEAVELDCVHGRCDKVKAVLEEAFHSGEDFLEPQFLATSEGSYARRLMHRDPGGKYSVVAMVWDVGQGTSLHDHAGEWCVECVYRGRIKVTSYDIKSPPDEPVVQFQEEATIFAGVGEAGALIPPFEYHTISNADIDRPAVTVHVYGHELTWCHVFVPVEGGFERVTKELTYTS